VKFPPDIPAFLRRGGVVAYPTESCFGFGCDPRNRDAVRRVLRLKQRPQRKGLILIAADYAQVERFIQPLTATEQQRLREDGAQAVTYLLPARSSCPRWLRGEHATLAVRLTAHPVARELCRRAGMALVSTSANLGGQRPVKQYRECQRLFGGKVRVLPGLVGKRRKPSTIRAWVGGRIVRN
jgi:L-threonylcarbamoyladenylate synthase